MSGLNPVILIQLMQHYNSYETGPRTFTFTRNNRIKIHKETEEEAIRRKSVVPEDIRKIAVAELNSRLYNSLHGKLGKKVWVDSNMCRIAVPLELSTGATGYGVLPTGSRVNIPNGKVVRAFTYWEKVNDIDLSCFGMFCDGTIKEFSWRTMYSQQSRAIAFSGDQTDGYNGGSEYFDINPKWVKRLYPGMEKIVFAANIYSNGGGTHFKDVLCTAGFMMRDAISSGEVYEPKTVKTSFCITSDSSFAYLFAIDLEKNQMIWLNLARAGNHAVAGESDRKFTWLKKYFGSTDVFNVYTLYSWAGDRVANREDAEILVTDAYGPAENYHGKEIIRSCDFEKMLNLLTK